MLMEKRFISDVSSTRNNHFNLIRMIAASGVLVSHAFPIALGRGVSDPLQERIGTSIRSICVILFFILSGFFITKSYEGSLNLRHYIYSRCLRLFPALGVCLLFSIIVSAFLTGEVSINFAIEAISYFFRNFTLFYGQKSLPGVFESNPFSDTINGSLWTLSHEFSCYILTMALGLAGFLRSSRVLLIFCFFYLLIYSSSNFIDFPDRIGLWLSLAWPYLCGTLFYIFRGHIDLSWKKLSVCVCIIIALVFIGSPPATFVPFLGYIVIHVGFIDAGGILKYNRLGDYSYGLYLYAFPIQQVMVQLGFITVFSNVLTSFLFSLFCAMLSWHFVERPSLELKHK